MTDIEKLKKHIDLIQRIYDDKIEYLENADKKEDAFKEGINAGLQSLNTEDESKQFYCFTKRGCLEQCTDCSLFELDKKSKRFKKLDK